MFATQEARFKSIHPLLDLHHNSKISLPIRCGPKRKKEDESEDGVQRKRKNHGYDSDYY